MSKLSYNTLDFIFHLSLAFILGHILALLCFRVNIPEACLVLIIPCGISITLIILELMRRRFISILNDLEKQLKL